MSIVHAQSTVSAQALPGSGDNLTLSGGTAADLEFGGIAGGGFRLDADGNMYRKQGYYASYVQVSSTTDWVRPAASAPGSYQARFTGLTGFSPNGGTNQSEDSWRNLSTLGDLIVELQTVGFEDERDCTFTFEIREGTGPVLVSGVYTIDVVRFDF